MIVNIKNARLAFPTIFEPKPFQGQGEPSYTCSLILDPKDAATIDAIKKAMIAVAKEKWAAKADAVLSSLKGTDKICLRDGSLKSEWSGFDGMMYVSTRNGVDKRPKIYDRDGKTQLIAADGRPYGGCYVNASIEVWAQDNGFGKRINASLRGVQFYKDGDAFGGGTPMQDGEFENISDFGEGGSTDSASGLL